MHIYVHYIVNPSVHTYIRALGQDLRPMDDWTKDWVHAIDR